MAIEDGFIFGYMTYMIFSLSFVKCEMYDYMVLAEDLKWLFSEGCKCIFQTNSNALKKKKKIVIFD